MQHASRELMCFQGYPAGAIKTHKELQDIIIEARKEKKAIRLYQVSQGGSLIEFYITSKCKIDKQVFEMFGHSEVYQVPIWMKSSFGNGRYWNTTFCLSDYNIQNPGTTASGYNRHMVFSNRKHATNYSNALKGDTAYQKAVREWHEHCSKMFDDL